MNELVATITNVGITSGISTILTVFIIWLCRNLIMTRLKNAVEHEYEKKIDILRTELRNSEESFKAELRTKASQIEALRSGALSGIINRQAIVYKRQIEAVERLWEAVISISPSKTISAIMARLKVDIVAGDAAKNPQVREMFKAIGDAFDAKGSTCIEASKIRPFVSKLAWAYCSAYQVIIAYAVVQCKMIQSGTTKNYFDVEAIKKLVKIALPHQEANIEKYGPSVFHHLLEELESKLLIEIEFMLSGKESDKKSIETAATIMKEADRITQLNVTSKQSM